MANKKINQLDFRVLSSTDLMLIGDPTTGISYKSLISGLGLVYVPYTGATANIALGEFGISGGYFQADLTPTMTGGVGRLIWNDSDGTLDLGLKGGNVTLQVGQEQILRVVNKTGADLLESQYKAVRIRLAAEGGSQGQRLAVVLAQGNNDVNSTDTIGIVTENITDNQEGFICTSGIVRGINTTGSLQGETWADGDVIYLSATTAGAITKVKPTAPNHSVVLGYVIYAHNTNGKIFVKCETGYEIGELHDCYLPTPSNNDGIFWNSTNLRYENKTVAGALGFTPISGSGVSGQVAYWNGTGSQTGSNNLFWDATNSRLGIGTNSPLVPLDMRGSLEIARFGTTGADNYINIKTSGGEFYLGRYAGGSYVWSRGTVPLDFYTNDIVRMRLTSAGNAIFQNGGTFTDSGQRLQVIGDAFIKGSGNTGSTNALALQNSDGTNLLRVRNDNLIHLGSTLSSYLAPGNRIASPSSSGTGFFFKDSAPTVDGRFVMITGDAYTLTSGSAVNFASVRGFSPTSSGATFINIEASGTINQTGGANGITRGLYVNPTLTAAADWRSIEWSNNSGWGLYGSGTSANYLGGRLTVGSVSANSIYALNVEGILNVSRATGNPAISFNNNAALSSSIAYLEATASELHIYAHTGRSIRFTSGANASRTMTLTANQRLLLGTETESTYLLDVNGTARVSGASTFARITATTSGIDLDYNSGILYHGASYYQYIAGANYTLRARTATGALIFATQDNDRMRITSSGNLLVGTAVDIPSSILTLASTTQGFLPPRMTTTQKNAISSPVAGLQVYDTTLNQMSYYNGTTWVNF